MVDKAWQSKKFRPQVSFREAAEDGHTGANIRQMSIAQSERRASQAGGYVKA